MYSNQIHNIILYINIYHVCIMGGLSRKALVHHDCACFHVYTRIFHVYTSLRIVFTRTNMTLADRPACQIWFHLTISISLCVSNVQKCSVLYICMCHINTGCLKKMCSHFSRLFLGID